MPDEQASVDGTIPSDANDVDDAWRVHGPDAVRFATALVGPSDAHDVAVAAFLRSTSQPSWRLIERFDRYLLRAVRNEARNLSRQRRRRWQRDMAAVQPSDTTDAYRDVDMLAAIADLSVQQRSVLFFAYWQDMTESEIADTLGISRGTVHRNLQRARASLKKAMT